MTFNCDKCGEVEHALYNGYNFGDRLLEGVMFEVRPKGKGYALTTPKDSKEYMGDLNERKWLKEGGKAVESEDTLECPQCHGDIAGPGA